MNKETDNTSKISDSTCKVAPETNATSADAPEQAKPTFKEAACSIIEILEQMKKPISDDGKDYLSPSLRSFLEGEIPSFLKAKIKTPEQILKEAIEEKGTELAELKAKLARLEEKEAENED